MIVRQRYDDGAGAAASGGAGVPDASAPTQTPQPPAQPQPQPQVIPVVAEALEVERRASVSTVRIRKQVHESQAQVDEMLTEERVEIERVAIGRRLDAPAEVRQEGDVLIVPIVEERLVVEKQLVLVEELRVTRRRRLRHETQPVTLRHEDVVVERHDAATNQWSTVDVPPATTPPAHAAGGSGSAGTAADAPAVSTSDHRQPTAPKPASR